MLPMIKNAVFLVLFFVSSSVYAQVNVTVKWQPLRPVVGADTIYYQPQKKLIWSDFKGVPDYTSGAAAVTESGFGFKMTMNSYNGKTNIVITVYCYFHKRKSWVKKDMDTDYALEHEQHHFDVTYINTCLFIQKLKEARFDLGNFSSLANKIYDDSFKALGKMQDDYDGQTSNGRIKPMQLSWNKKIEQQLAALIIN
jgi:hypothetical protein